MSTLVGYVQQSSPRSLSEGVEAMPKLNRRGELCVIDWYAQMMMEGRGYQVRLGTITTPITGDIAITDTAAECCADAPAGLIVIPVEAQCDIEVLTGTLPQFCVKAVGSVSTSGTAFVPLPLFLNDNSPKLSARSTARTGTAGNVTVTAELATTTLQLYTQTMTVAGDVQALYKPVVPAFIGNDACVYLQVGSAGAGSGYFAHLNYIELLASVVE